MKDVDYVKLSEQYASFLVAIGGVSITALALVLSLGSTLNKRESGPFLVFALVVATVSCFIGSHMMAETAAFIQYSKERLKVANPKAEIPPSGVPLGKRLFLLASTNIFVAVVLVLFALMLLPTAFDIQFDNLTAASINLISFVIFATVVLGALCWMFLAAFHRTRLKGTFRRIPAKRTWGVVYSAIGTVLAVATALWLIQTYNKNLLLGFTFIPIALTTGASLLYFAIIFKNSHEAYNRELRLGEICFFSSAITLSYTCLVFAGIRAMFYS